MVLAAINEKLDVNSIQTALNARQEKLEYFANVGDLMKISPFDSLDATEKTEADKIFGVRSNYFKAKIEVLLSYRKRQFTSHLLRNDQSQVFVYSRSLAPF
jgi:general secretion pathway protein K